MKATFFISLRGASLICQLAHSSTSCRTWPECLFLRPAEVEEEGARRWSTSDVLSLSLSLSLSLLMLSVSKHPDARAPSDIGILASPKVASLPIHKLCEHACMLHDPFPIPSNPQTVPWPYPSCCSYAWAKAPKNSTGISVHPTIMRQEVAAACGTKKRRPARAQDHSLTHECWITG